MSRSLFPRIGPFLPPTSGWSGKQICNYVYIHTVRVIKSKNNLQTEQPANSSFFILLLGVWYTVVIWY